MRNLYPLGMLFVFFALVGCEQREIRVYTAQKNMIAQAPPSATSAAVPKWKAPSHWVSQPPSSFRIGSFSIPGPSGDADLSITFLSGQAGGILANLNRWRGQIQLPPIAAEALSANLHDLVLKNGKVRLVGLISPDLKTRVYVAIWEKSDGTWFFKMTGPAATVTAEETHFKAFLESVVWP